MRRKQQLYEETEQSYQQRIGKEIVQIRRSDRETAFKKKRNFRQDFYPSDLVLFDQAHQEKEKEESQTNPETNQAQKDEKPHEFIIIDTRFTQNIIQFNSFEINMDMFDTFIEMIQKQDALVIIGGAIGLRRLLSEQTPPIQQVIDAGILDLLLQLIQFDSEPQIQLEVTWCIANIAAGTTDQCALLINKGAIPLLIGLIKDKKQGVMQQAVWGIGNISTDCSQYRNMAIEEGAIQAIVDVMLYGKIGDEFRKECCWALANLCRGNPPPEHQKVKHALKVISSMLATGCIQSLQLFSDCCWALSYHCEGMKGKADVILDFDLLGRIIPLAQASDNIQLLMPCLRIVGQVSTGNHECTKTVLQKGGLDLLEKCLFHEKKLIRRESVWILSNIAASTFQHIKAVFQKQNLIERVIDLFFTDAEEIRKEIAFIFSNMCHGGRSLCLDEIFVQCNIIEGFALLLTSTFQSIIYQALQALEPILRLGQKKKELRGDSNNLMVEALMSCEVAKALENLQYHKNDKIYILVHYILTKYIQLVDQLDGIRVKQQQQEQSSEDQPEGSSGQDKQEQKQQQATQE